MNIVLITPVYPSKNAPRGTTPVVHYFTREWVKMGHSVTVFHLETKYPFFIYWFTRLFESKLNSKLGYLVSTKSPKEYEEVNEGVKVYHCVMRKPKPAPRFPKSEINRICSRIEALGKTNGKPDVFIGHWDSPQLEILNHLRKAYPEVKNALVLHSLNRDLGLSYSNDFNSLFANIDVIGFRSTVALNEFKEKYFSPKRSFIAASGISLDFLENSEEKKFVGGISSFIFVGALIKRKHPLDVLCAVSEVFGKDNFSLAFVGAGNESQTIKDYYKQINSNGNIIMPGRIDRVKVIDYLKNSDVFVMISENETFGLVYLEAMSMGCITIASKGEGMDGIITNGENGFLCKAGDKDDLVKIITTIRSLSCEELQRISKNAVNTARAFSDQNVALNYLKAIYPN